MRVLWGTYTLPLLRLHLARLPPQPRTDLQLELLQYLKSKHRENHRVSVERVVSGNGLVGVYEFLCEIYSNMYVYSAVSNALRRGPRPLREVPEPGANDW